MSKPNGFIIYRGPSQLDGLPIVVIATGFADKSENIKTGAMIQTWILREDISPLEAVHNGQDTSICGACPHRGVVVDMPDGTTRNKLRACYVLSFQAPLAVWRAYRRGSYVDASEWSAADLVHPSMAPGAARFPAAGNSHGQRRHGNRCAACSNLGMAHLPHGGNAVGQ